MFSEDTSRKFEQIIGRYPEKQAALIPILHLAQDELGHLSDECVDYVAGLLGVSSSHVEGVATFYSMLRREPLGKFRIQICRSISCGITGCDKILVHLKSKLGIDLGQTTPDGLFSLIHVECLAACGNAPVIQINNDYHEDLTIEKVDKILDELRSQKDS